VSNTRYARSGDVHIAYQVIGDGPIDVVYVPGFVSNVELWEDAPYRELFDRLASFARLIIFDKRGTGLSDPVPLSDLPTLEERMDDVRAVLDAAGSERASLLGVSEGGPLALLFAASFPDRVNHLVLGSSAARFGWSPDTPWGWTEDRVEFMLGAVGAAWGTGEVVMALTQDADRNLIGEAGSFERRSASPGAVKAIIEMASQIDVRSVLPLITAPTLVMHAADDPTIAVESGREMGRLIPGARYVELDEGGHTFLWTHDEYVDLVEEFVTGAVAAPESDRILATILFTDIVSSTDHQARVGDRAWREILDRYDSSSARQLERFRGRRIQHTGDGFLAVFDGPARAVRAALALRDSARQLGLETRAGLHTGECETRGEDITGIAVSTASRVMSKAGAGEVLVSRTVTDLVAGSGLGFASAGRHVLKGVPGEWDLFAVDG
jgi:pimeloyl-ACP methyl ester carboxylesterase/plasmid stabilization system protein ParE